MAVTFTDSIVDDYVWSLERPMYLRYDKDSDNSQVIVSIAITQGSYSKTLTLKYSGLVKVVVMNISDLIKPYFQHLDYVDDRNINRSDLNSLIYTANKTQNITVTITDTDGSINTTQFFIRNGNNSFEKNTYFGDNNYSLAYDLVDETHYISESYKLLNYPVYLRAIDSNGHDTQIKIQRLKLDNTLIDEILYTTPAANDERIIAIPIGKANTSVAGLEGIKVKIETYLYNGSTWSVWLTNTWIFNYKTPCDDSLKKIVYFEGRYGGLETFTFANNINGINKTSNEFILQNGDKTRLNIKNRRTGNYISEYVAEVENEIYTAFFLSEKIQTYLDTDLIDILLASKTHRIKQVNNIEMKQYTFAYEEVERLKY